MTREWSSSIADRFAAHYADVRGHVRSSVVQAHLRAHLPPPPASIVAIGGGTGEQAVPLSRAGYHVTVVDPSERMLQRAANKIATESASVAERIALLKATGQQARHVLPEASFDAVLCHAVLPYLDDPAALIGDVCALARPGGVVSIVAKNARTFAVRPALDGDWSGALDAFDAETEINRLGLTTRGDTVEHLSAVLSDAGVEVDAWYGVRLFTEGWTAQPPAPDDLHDIVAVELEASRRDPYRHLSRLFHLIGTKRTAQAP